jgi:hypothetical protein
LTEDDKQKCEGASIPQCQTPSQNQEATEFQGYSLPLPSLLGQK